VSIGDVSGIDLGNRLAGKIASSAMPARIRNDALSALRRASW
jgi:hypothetical protein